MSLFITYCMKKNKTTCTQNLTKQIADSQLTLVFSIGIIYYTYQISLGFYVYPKYTYLKSKSLYVGLFQNGIEKRNRMQPL